MVVEVVVMVVGLQLQMSLVGALFFDVVCGYALLAAAATHTCLFFCSDPFSTHTDTHIHTHTPTHIFRRITLPSHPKRSFPSLLIRFCFMTRIFTFGLISRAQSRQGPCERGLFCSTRDCFSSHARSSLSRQNMSRHSVAQKPATTNGTSERAEPCAHHRARSASAFVCRFRGRIWIWSLGTRSQHMLPFQGH